MKKHNAGRMQEKSNQFLIYKNTKMAKRIKVKNISNVTLDQAQQASAAYAETSTKLSKIEAKMNDEINKVKNKYSEDITELNEALAEPIEVLQVFGNEQKTAWGKKKSMELLHCNIGFRQGNPKVDKAKKFTWDAVVELLKKKPLFKKFIRTKEEVNKEAILAEKNDALLGQLKEDCFIEIVQEENFFIDLKKEEVATA
jgi:phage host-nuclease inhibitor protein Gam